MRTTIQDILNYAEDNDIKFIKFSFCDIFGTLKNMSVFSNEFATSLEYGVCFDGSAIPGFMNIEDSDLVLMPDLDTMKLMPWRPSDGSAMRLYCDILRPNGQPFEGNSRGYLRSVVKRFEELGLTVNIGTECEFYLFKTDEQGEPTKIPFDHGNYFETAPLDNGENIRREICLTLEEMGLKPFHSHHESGDGQNEVDFMHATALEAADNLITFKNEVKSIASRNGLYASFMPKPLPDQAGNGLHINISLYKDGKNLFAQDIDPDSIAGHFMAGILKHSRALTAFCNPVTNSYSRFGSCEAPKYISWSRQNRSQMVRIPTARHDNDCRMELRSPDPACNPYLAFGLILAAGLEGIKEEIPLPPPTNRNLFLESSAYGLDCLPLSLEEAVREANASNFIANELHPELYSKYFEQQCKQYIALRDSENPEEFERQHYFWTL